MSDNSTIEQRINDFRALCASNRIKYKQVTDRAKLDYDSVVNNMRVNNISSDRMDLLEESALEIRDEQKKQTATA